MISTIKKNKNTFTLTIIIWFHRPVLSYNKRQSRTGQMCSHMIFISFFCGNKCGASKECVHNSPVNLRKTRNKLQNKLKQKYIKSRLLSLYTHV
jgi:hypothetical protein